MAGTYWLTVLPDTSKLAPGIKKSLDGIDDKPLGKLGDSAQTAQSRVQNLGGKLAALPGPLGVAGGAVGQFGAQFTNMGGGAEKGAARAKNAVNKMSVGIAGLGLAAGASLLKIGDTFDQVGASIAAQTGATGDKLDGLTDIAKKIGTQVPVSFDQAGAAVAELSKSTDLSGGALEDLAAKVANVSRMTGGDAATNAKNFSQLLQQWQVPADEGASKLETLFKASQEYNLSLPEAIGNLRSYGAIMQNAGFSMTQTTDLFGKLQTAGLDVSRLMPGLNAAFRNWAKDGKNTKAELNSTVDAIKNASSTTEALSIATDAFGAEGAQRLTTAIRTTGLSFDDLGTSLQDADGSIEESSQNTTALHEQLTLLKNKALAALAPAATKVFDAVSTGLGTFTDWVSKSDALMSVLKVIGPILGVMGGTILAIAAATKVWAAVQAVLNLALSANPIGIVVLAIAGLVTGLVMAYQHCETFRNIVNAVWNALKVGIQWVGDKMMWLWKSVFIPAWDGIKTGIGAAWDFIKGVFDKIKNGFTALKNGVVGIANGIKDGVKAAFSGLAGIIKAPLHALGGLLAGIPDKVFGISIPGASSIKSWGQTLQGLAGGGRVSGPGTGTSDSVLIRASHGEYMVNAKATRKHLKLIQAINADALPAFAEGGLVNPKARQQVAGMVGVPYAMGGFSDSSIDCCLVGSTMVYGPDGVKPIAELARGDRVFSYEDGKLTVRSVDAQWFSARQQVYRVRTRNRAVVGSANHPFLRLVQTEGSRHIRAAVEPWSNLVEVAGPLGVNELARRSGLSASMVSLLRRGLRHPSQDTVDRLARAIGCDSTDLDPDGTKVNHPARQGAQTGSCWDVEWARLDELNIGDLIVTPDDLRTNDGMNTLPDGRAVSIDLAWLMGLMIGDGTVYERWLACCVYGETRERASRVMCAEGATSVRYYDSAGIHANAPDLAASLNDAGMHLRGHEKRVPECVWGWSADRQRAFLDGYCDADGHRPANTPKHGVATYASASWGLINDARALHITLGDPVSNLSTHHRIKPIVIKGTEVKNARDLHSFSVWQSGGRRGCNSKIRHNGGIARWIDSGDFNVTRVLAITEEGEADTYDIKVDGAHNFIADGIVVHNSGMVSATVNSYLGLPMFDSRMSTPSEGAWLRGKGALPGRGGAGDLTVLWWDGGTGGFSNGHTVAVLPDGQVIESGGSHGNVAIGAGTTPASDPQWTNAMHFPKEMLMGAQNPQAPGGGSSSGGGRRIGASASSGGATSAGGSSGGSSGGSAGAAGASQEAGKIGGMLVSGIKDELGGVFSDPMEWPNVKSGMAVLNFLGGKIGGGKQGGDGGVLGGVGDALGLGGLFGGLASATSSDNGPWTPKHPGDTLSPGLFNPATPGASAPSFQPPSAGVRPDQGGTVNDNRTIFQGNVDGDVSRALDSQHKQRIARTRTTKVGG